ncbi:MAG: ABC transporter permease [Opitutaceae bacterium]|nr:ABC transporter permease [Opitutaceae bacterium]
MLLETFRQDVRFGLRVLIKEKAFCALAVAVLAVGICAVTTQFAVVNGVLLHAFDFRAADRLVDVNLVSPTNFSPANFNGQITTADFVDMRERQQSFEFFVGYLNGSTINLTNDGNPKRLQGGYVTHDFFRALGVAPVLGRDFLPEEDRPGVDKAVLLSDSLWRSDFGADPGVLGKVVRVNGRTGTVVGVMPPKFSFPANEQLWLPVNTEFPVKDRKDPGINGISIIATLKPGVSIDQAQAEITGFAKHFAETYPETNGQFTMGYVRPLIGAFTGGNLTFLLMLMLVFCVGVLLIGCSNVMNMQFARAALRTRELAVRSSLGATRVRLLRQMLTESLLLATIGAGLGVALAYWATGLLDAATHTQQNPIPAWMHFTIDGRVLALVVAATVLATIGSGLLPAWMASRVNNVEALKDAGRGNTSRAVNLMTRALVVGQIVMTCLLLTGALLFTQSIVRQQTIDHGYDTSAVLTGRMGLMEGDYPSSKERQVFYERLLRELRVSPQFDSVALTNRFRMVFSGAGPVEIEGRTYAKDEDRVVTQFENVTPGYFATLRVPVHEGRDFTDDDSDQRQPVAIVNTRFARRHFGNESPLGRRFRTTQANGTAPGPWRVIIGVVGDVRMQGPFNARSDGSGFYIPYFATPFGPATEEAVALQFGTAIVRPRGGQRPEALAQALQDVVKRVDPNLPLYFVSTPRESIEVFLAQNQLIARMFTIFGAVAVALASIGLYGVMSFSVNQRQQEFGVRMALGAERMHVLRLVLRQGGLQLGIGLVLGMGLCLGAAFLARGPLTHILVLISPLDVVTYCTVTALIVVVSLIATLVPARRATKVDPLTALRAE